MTLIEMLVTIGIFVLIGGILSTVYLSITRFQGDESNRLVVDLSANHILSTVHGHFRQGKQILGSATISGNSTLYTTDATTVVFTIPSLISGAPSPTQTDTVVVAKVGDRLMLYIDAAAGTDRTDSESIIATQVKDVYLRYSNPAATAATNLSLTIQAEKTISTGNYIQTSIVYGTLQNHP